MGYLTGCTCKTVRICCLECGSNLSDPAAPCFWWVESAVNAFLNELPQKVSGIWSCFWSELTADRTFGEFGTFLELSFVVNGLVFAWPGLTERYRDKLKDQLSFQIQAPISEVLDDRNGTEDQDGNRTSGRIIDAADAFLKKFEESVQAATRWSRRCAIAMMIIVAAMLFGLRQEFDVGCILRLVFLLSMIGPGGYLLGATWWTFSSYRRKCDNQFGYLGNGERGHDPLEAREKLDAAIEKRRVPTEWDAS